jgi:demethylmenaquinone methyltransferase/2-methoxy-6-polyprenyl-1,4-benzoquinol methylase
MPEAAAPAKGTRPQGAVTEADASRQVREMFTQIAPRYDLLNHLLSLQLDRLWRARVARRLRAILDRPDAVVLDLCCGTGDLAFSLARAGRARVIGADFSHAMLVRARQKSETLVDPAVRWLAEKAPASESGRYNGEASNAAALMPFFEADALRLPFAGGSFDLVTTAFGFRNLANYEDGLKEIHRVLKPSGTLAILEFTEPPAGLVGNFYRWYFRNILPRIGGLLSGDRSAYTYLPASVSRFFRPAELASLMTAVGYGSAEFRVWTFGTVALHTGRKLR